MRSESGFQIAPNWPYIGKKRYNFSAWRHLKQFWNYFVSPVKFGCWSRFHINTITGSGVITIFFYKRLIRNPEIANTPFWVLPNVGRPGRVRDTTFGMNVCNEMLVNVAKCQGYKFYSFWVVKGKVTVN